MARTPTFKNPDYIRFHLEKDEKDALYELTENRINGHVNHINDKINEAAGGGTTETGRPKGHTSFIPDIPVAKVLRVLIQDLLYQAESMTDEELFVKFAPEIAVQQGILTTREAIREGLIPLTKQHVIDRHIAAEELSVEQLSELGFVEDEIHEMVNAA